MSQVHSTVYAFYVPRVQFKSPEYSLCPRVQFMSPEYILCPQSAVYVLRVQFMSQESSLCPKSTVYDPLVQFMYPEYSLCPNSTVYVFVPRVQFMSSLRFQSPQNQFMSQSAVYFLTVQFI